MNNLKSNLSLSSNVINDKQKWANNIQEYNLLNLIGSGSFGRVFRSYCKQNGQECAVKCIPKQNSPNIKKILSEVYIHIRLNHQNILQLHTVLEDTKAVYLIMEICHGGSLSQLINEEIRRRKCLEINDPLNPILPYPMISTIVIQLCQALEYLHRNSIVHRDINLNNILLDKPLNIQQDDFKFSGQIKLADFGLAIEQNKSFAMDDGESISGNTICGTPGFISPEVWYQQQNVSYKSDIFSLGSIVYSCVSGHTPKNDIDLSSFLPMIANLISQLLNHDPTKRPELEQIKQHIFVSGRIHSLGLHPIEKTTNTMKLKIDQKANAEIEFINDNFSVKVSQDGSKVIVVHHNICTEYQFYELPEKYWKHYLYVKKFVNLVKSKTSKITINCLDWFKQNQYDKEYISKCILMNNGDFEITLHDEILNSDRKLLLKDVIASEQLKRFEMNLFELFSKILYIEKELEQISKQLKMNMFPVTLGIDCKLLENYKQKQNNLTENNSFLTSKVLQSVPINGIGYATQFTNGSIKVNFNDGSDLCMDKDNQIFFLQDGILKKFSVNETLPEMVVNKIAQLPTVIEHLKEMKESTFL